MSSSLPIVTQDALLPPELQQEVNKVCKVVDWDTIDNPEARKDVVGMFVFLHPHIDGHMMDKLPSLKVISNFGVGVDHIDVEAARVRGIPVGNTPDCLNDSVGDLAIGLILSAARNIVSGDKFAKDPHTTAFNPNWFGTHVTGSTVGIIGLGRIGMNVASRLKGFKTRTLYWARHKRSEQVEQQHGVTYAPLDGLLEQSDFVVLCLPVTPETTKIMTKSKLEKMKQGSYLINVARGALVDHNALVDVLQHGPLAGAALDVTDPEPLPRNHPLLSLPNVVITPHFGSATYQTRIYWTASKEDPFIGVFNKI